MLIKDIVGEGTPQIYGKYKNTLKRRYRCQSGPRKGRIVADPATCTAPINIQKKQTMKATRAKRGTIQGKLSSYGPFIRFILSEKCIIAGKSSKYSILTAIIDSVTLYPLA